MTFCTRPHRDQITETSRFIMAFPLGRTIAGTKYEMGDEVPTGLLNLPALRQEYGVRYLELADYVAGSPDMEYLREACARRGVDLTSQPEMAAPLQAAAAKGKRK